MDGWLLIIYFKVFFFFGIVIHPPGRTGYIIYEALWKMKIQGSLLKNC